MGSHTQLLLDTLQNQMSTNGRHFSRIFVEDDVSHFTGFLIEDLKVSTTSPLNMDGEINPLLRLLYGKQESQFPVNQVHDHLERIEMKIRKLKSRVPYTFEQRLLVGAAEVDEEEDEFFDAEPNEKEKKPQKKGSKENKGEEKNKPPSGTKKGKCENEADNKNCFKRLLFSKCWSGNQGKNGSRAGNSHRSGGKPRRVKKGACPAYSTCPCGDNAPCAKIVRKPCPANDKSSGKGKSPKKKKDDNAFSSLCGKFCPPPCLFSKKGDEDGRNGGGKSGWRCGACNRKKHVHTPCCCRCKDNPPLPEEKNGKDVKKQASKTSGKKANDEKTTSKEGPKKASGTSSGEYYDAEEMRSVHSAIIIPKKDGKDPTQESTLRCIGCTDCDVIRRSHEYVKTENIQAIKSDGNPDLSNTMKNDSDGNMENVVSSMNLLDINLNSTTAMKKGVSKEPRSTMEELSRSSTSMQALLPPSISSESSECNMVSHRIERTLSTIHGPVRVEQKIVLKGSKNGYVVVTHGEGCECNICSALKNDNMTGKNCDGSLEVVRYPTDNGCDRLINHGEDCQCTLCSVLGRGITEDPPRTDTEKSPSSIVLTAWSEENSETNLETPENPRSMSMSQDSQTITDKIKICGLKDCSNCERGSRKDTKKRYKNREEKLKKKKCYCLKCVKRRKVKRLKKKLKHALEPIDFSEVLRELSHHGFTVEQVPEDDINRIEVTQGESLQKESRAFNKKVSFSGDTKRMVGIDEKNIVHPVAAQPTKTKELITITKVEDNVHQKRITDSSRSITLKSSKREEIKPGGHSKEVNPQSMNTTVRKGEPCDCVICNGPYSDSTSQITRTSKSKGILYRPSREEEQSCFPEMIESSTKSCCKKIKGESEEMRERILDEVTHPDDDYIRPPTRCEPGCKGRCRYLTPRDEISRVATEQITPVVLQASSDKLPPKVLYWVPSSPNLAASFSSESYYIPDMDEIPSHDRGSRSSKGQITPYSTFWSQKSSQSQPSSAGGSRKGRKHKHGNRYQYLM